jgi:hypothetical protein
MSDKSLRYEIWQDHLHIGTVLGLGLVDGELVTAEVWRVGFGPD